MSYSFITSDKDLYENNTTRYYAVGESKIESIAYSSTYGGFGQSIDHDDAGDWATIDTQEAANKINEWLASEEIERTVSTGDTLLAYEEQNDLFNFAIGLQGVTLEEVMVKGFNYWDGHNHASVVVEADWDTNYHTEKDEELITFLNKAIDGMEKVKEGTGVKYYKFVEGDRQVNISESFWQGEWAEYRLEIVEVEESEEA